MTTLAEIEAAIAKAEKAGRTDLADKLRVHADQMRVTDQARIDAAITKAESMGRTDLADKLRAASGSSPPPEPAAPLPGPILPPKVDPEADAAAAQRELEAFEAANPILAGRYSAGKLPKVGEVVLGKGGGGKSGAARYTVQPWRAKDQDTFGGTAGKMMEGPTAALSAFGEGLSGGESPTRNYLANDPLTRNLPAFALTGLGAVGDLGGAALSGIGAGLAGGIGLATEIVPGQSDKDESRLGNDLLGMMQFAVPELAGASSIPARVATAAPKVAPTVKAIPEGLAEADKLGIPVLRSDIKPPETFIGKAAQKTGESIPLAGTGGLRAKQAAARVDAVKDFITEYVGDRIIPAIDEVTEEFRKVHSEAVQKYAKQKNDVIKGLDAAGEVPVPKAISAIDAEIARLKAAKNEGFAPIIAELENFKASITGQKLPEIDMNRAYIGKVFGGLDAAKFRDACEKALSAVYGPLKEDNAQFIKKFGGSEALNKWGMANAKLSDLADGMKNTALRRALKTGEMTPEATRQLLFSQKPSDVRLLYSRLNDHGRKAARTAIVQEAIAKAGSLDALTPDKFKTALSRLGGQIGVFFKGEDLEAADGLIKALRLTERGARAADAPPTGVQALPSIMTLGLGSWLGFGPAIATAGTIGAIARVYESVGVKSALRAVAQAKPGKAQSAAVQRLESSLKSAGMPAVGQAANTPKSDYEALWGKY